MQHQAKRSAVDPALAGSVAVKEKDKEREDEVSHPVGTKRGVYHAVLVTVDTRSWLRDLSQPMTSSRP